MNDSQVLIDLIYKGDVTELSGRSSAIINRVDRGTEMHILSFNSTENSAAWNYSI
jgi:hypothetical protein